MSDLLFSSRPSVTDRDHNSEHKGSLAHVITEIPKIIPKIITFPERNFTIFDFTDKGMTSLNYPNIILWN